MAACWNVHCFAALPKSFGNPFWFCACIYFKYIKVTEIIRRKRKKKQRIWFLVAQEGISWRNHTCTLYDSMIMEDYAHLWFYYYAVWPCECITAIHWCLKAGAKLTLTQARQMHTVNLYKIQTLKNVWMIISLWTSGKKNFLFANLPLLNYQLILHHSEWGRFFSEAQFWFGDEFFLVCCFFIISKDTLKGQNKFHLIWWSFWVNSLRKSKFAIV